MRPIVVCDVGLNHNGNMMLVESLIAMAAAGGADYVKFQIRTVEKCYKKEYLDRARVTEWGKTVRDEKNGLELTAEQFDRIDESCRRNRIGWYVTPFTECDVAFCAVRGLPFIKIASQCVSNGPLLDTVRDSGMPVIASTGMSTLEEIDELVDFFGGQLHFLLHCVSTYPTADTDVNLSAIKTLKERYPGIRIGFSSHSDKVIYPVAAALLGAAMIEFHVTVDRNLPGPDHAASIGPTGFDRIMKHLKSIDDGMGTGAIAPHPDGIKKGGNYAWR